ncbi:MAG: hypothetical protein H7A33_05300 [Deltaproteobacteria bacterium]|nr:hypothetical protein [Deltaproteobacteria bacterium]
MKAPAVNAFLPFVRDLPLISGLRPGPQIQAIDSQKPLTQVYRVENTGLVLVRPIAAETNGDRSVYIGDQGTRQYHQLKLAGTELDRLVMRSSSQPHDWFYSAQGLSSPLRIRWVLDGKPGFSGVFASMSRTQFGKETVFPLARINSGQLNEDEQAAFDALFEGAQFFAANDYQSSHFMVNCHNRDFHLVVALSPSFEDKPKATLFDLETGRKISVESDQVTITKTPEGARYTFQFFEGASLTFLVDHNGQALPEERKGTFVSALQTLPVDLFFRDQK